MKVTINIKKEVELKTLIIRARVRCWDGTEVNGIEDEHGELIPCREGDYWVPIIDIDRGIITNWMAGKTAIIHYKVCDDCGFELLDENENVLLSAKDGYVPSTLCPTENGYGDYIIMNVDEQGVIEGWNFDINDF